jgi:hypothetical protein
VSVVVGCDIQDVFFSCLTDERRQAQLTVLRSARVATFVSGRTDLTIDDGSQTKDRRNNKLYKFLIITQYSFGPALINPVRKKSLYTKENQFFLHLVLLYYYTI